MRGRRLTALLAVALLATLASGAGCGYRMESRGLPEGAASLGIGTIRNRTFTGELDVRLKHELRRKLLRNPAFALVSPERSQLVLEVDLLRADFVRSLDVSNTSISSLVLVLEGRINLRKARGGQPVIRNAGVAVSTRLDFDRSVIESAAVRDEIEHDAVVAFAAKVEQLLYEHF